MNINEFRNYLKRINQVNEVTPAAIGSTSAILDGISNHVDKLVNQLKRYTKGDRQLTNSALRVEKLFNEAVGLSNTVLDLVEKRGKK